MCKPKGKYKVAVLSTHMMSGPDNKNWHLFKYYSIWSYTTGNRKYYSHPLLHHLVLFWAWWHTPKKTPYILSGLWTYSTITNV